MQLSAAQTSLEPQPRRVDRRSRKPFVSQNALSGDGSRLTSEPHRSNARASCTQAPDVESNKLPNMRSDEAGGSSRYVSEHSWAPEPNSVKKASSILS